MNGRTNPRASARTGRRAVVAFAAASALTATGCPDTTWLVKAELSPVRMPHDITIMVWKSDRVLELDEEGSTDAMVLALKEALRARGFEPTVEDLDGEPRLPRIELVFWTPPSETAAPGRVGQSAITVDCAFVSGKDEVQFVGRVRGYGKEGHLAPGAQAAANAVAEALLDG
jgi:hypothetical protein